MIAYPAISPLTGDRHAPEQVIGMTGLGDRHHPESLIDITGLRTPDFKRHSPTPSKISEIVTTNATLSL